jgi:hypothetical protein
LPFSKGFLFTTAGTAATAVVAARIPGAEFIAPIDVEPDLDDALAAARERCAAARREADAAKSEAGLRQAVRQDMRLRAKARPPTLPTSLGPALCFSCHPALRFSCHPALCFSCHPALCASHVGQHCEHTYA